MTWSTDGFYRETPDKVAYRIEEGRAVVRWQVSQRCSGPTSWRFGACLIYRDSLADLEIMTSVTGGVRSF